MVTLFGIVSVRSRERDALARDRQRLVLGVAGGLVGDQGVTYDMADLEQLVQGGLDPIPADTLAYWQAGRERNLVSLAVVHAAVPATVVASLHGDAVCALANMPEARSACEAALGGEVVWLEGHPGPALARSVASLRASAALVPGLGLLAWGPSSEAVLARAELLEQRARDWLTGRGLELSSGAAEADDLDRVVPAALDATAERDLVALRGQLSRGRPRVLQIDSSLDGLARRDDAERLTALASGLEPLGPWATRSSPAPMEHGRPGVSTLLVPGLGLVSAGGDEPAARDRALVAAHTHRVAAVLIDGRVAAAAVPTGRGGDRSQGASGDSAEQSLEPTPGAALHGRIIIVTGAASGIGRDVARHLASIGAQLALADVSRDGLEAVADELDGPQGRPLTVAGDLTDESVVDGLVSATVARFGGVDGAVLNVGVALPGELKHLSTADWRRSLDVNTTSHFLLVRRLLPVLEAQGLGGSLVFIGSKNMFSPGAGFGAYSASKAALAQLARLVAIEAGPHGVRSNIVNPDNVFEGSALWSPELRAQRAAVYKIRPEELEAYYTQRNLMKVPISGMDVARAVAFLLSDEAAKTTACILTVDGGVPGVFPR